MANKITDLTVFNGPTVNNPDGTLKDQEYSAPGVVSVVGSRIYGRFFTDVLGVFQRMVRAMGAVLSGTTDEQLVSQFYTALEAKITNQNLFNWYQRSATTGGATAINVCIYHPDINIWYAVDDVNLYYYEADALWILRNALPSIPTVGNVATITPTKAVFGLASGDLWFVIASTAAPTLDTGLAMATVSSLASKYAEGGSDEFVVAGGASGAIEYSTTGPGGSWVVPATPPVTTSPIVGICWGGGSKFFAIDQNAKLFKSLDNCVTWTTVISRVTDIFVGGQVDCDRDSGRLVVTGTTNVTYTWPLSYSDDDGVTWTRGIIEPFGVSGSVGYNVRHIGLGVWIATGNFPSGRAFQSGATPDSIYFLLSFDNGVTWDRPDYPFDNAVFPGHPIGFDGNKIMLGAINSPSGTVLSSRSKKDRSPVLF